MSVWTHVIGAIYINSLNHTDVEDHLIALLEPVPYGSEGPLEYDVQYVGYEDGNSRSLKCAVVTIWGDLRDVDSPHEVVAWVEKFIHDLMETPRPGFGLETIPMYPRQVAVHVGTEDGQSVFLSWDEDEGKVIRSEA
jgi:hypothetical protein